MISAAKIIRAEIREREYDSKSYPTNEELLMLIKVGNGSHTI